MVNPRMHNKNSVKKIAWIVPKIYRKTESRVYKESQSLSSAGYNVKIFSMRQMEKDLEYEIDNEVVIERINVLDFRYIGISKIKSVLSMLFFTRKVLQKLKIYNPDIIYCMNLPSVHIGIIGKKIYSAKCIYDSHDLYIEQPARSKMHPLFRKLFMICEKVMANNVDLVIQTTDGRANIFKRYYKISPNKIMNKPLHPDCKISMPNSMKQFLDSSQKIVGYVGSVQKHRGLEQMVNALVGIDNIKIVILGYARTEWAQDFIKKNKQNVTLVPPVHPDEITLALSVFDLGLSLIQNSCQSYYYSCPTKVFEFIVAGVPQIASNFPEMRRLIIDNPHGPVGRVIDPANTEEIRKNVVEILNTPDKYKLYKNNCNLLKNQCIWKVEEKKLIKLVDNLIYN